jgi:hypothetical protein
MGDGYLLVFAAVEEIAVLTIDNAVALALCHE